ncbi:MAG TPA: hypothetical protein VG821_12455 [Rhizomicrobium sp.]|jgi:hypothetical protein|nr:hypothetical protein [Rhizomicrobium sp.]
MTEFRAIEIDFDIHKLIEGERSSFAESPNEALRRLLKLPTKVAPKAVNKANDNRRSWSDEGISLPHGTAIRMEYNKRPYAGEIVDGRWVVDGKIFDSPSGAASGIAITKNGKKTRLDGWMYWEVKQPGESQWTRISFLRRVAKA